MHDDETGAVLTDGAAPALRLEVSPNPFAESTALAFSLPGDETVTLEIWNLEGRRVRTVVDRVYKAGRWTVSWDGTNEERTKVPSGIYLARLEAGGFTSVQKLNVLR